MQTYILILIGILVLLLIGVVYFGWRKIINLEIESNKNKYDIEALRGLLSKLLDGDEIEMNPSFFKKDKPYNIQMNANELKNRQFGGGDEESEVDTLHSSDDEEEIPEDESTVSIENIEDEDSDDSEEDSDDSEEDSDDSEEDSDDSDDSDENSDDSEEDEEKTESKDEESKEDKSEQESEVKEINLEKTEDKQENDLEEEDKTEIKVVEVKKNKEDEVANKNVKKIPNESLKSYKAGDVVVSKNDGNKYKVVMYKNQKRWKLIEE
jgi:hypothetical protein